jgi:hypothetical protein
MPVGGDEIVHKKRTGSIQQQSTKQKSGQVVDQHKTAKPHDATEKPHKVTDLHTV